MEQPAFTPNIIEAPDEEVMTTGRAGGLRRTIIMDVGNASISAETTCWLLIKQSAKPW
mgnify:CR=1 FL=1|jgi:hypothetical protein